MLHHEAVVCVENRSIRSEVSKSLIMFHARSYSYSRWFIHTYTRLCPYKINNDTHKQAAVEVHHHLQLYNCCVVVSPLTMFIIMIPVIFKYSLKVFFSSRIFLRVYSNNNLKYSQRVFTWKNTNVYFYYYTPHIECFKFFARAFVVIFLCVSWDIKPRS